MGKSNGAASSSSRWKINWLITMLVAAGLAWLATSRTAPQLPRPLTLEVVFPAGEPDRSEPLLCTGVFASADFINVRYLTPTTGVIEFDSWGAGGPKSERFELKSGQRRTLQLEIPGFDPEVRAALREKRPLRVSIDGVEVLRQPVSFHLARPDLVYFANNPIGGNNYGEVFRGRLFRPGRDHALLGGIDRYYSASERFLQWLRTRTWHLVPLALCALACGVFLPRLWRAARARAAQLAQGAPLIARTKAPHVTFALGTLGCALVFGTLITHGTGKLIYEDAFGAFYDYQAKSLLEGRLDVPPVAISGEAFVVEGKTYGYFGVTPALLRVPFVLADVAFGKLTRCYMLAYYLACLAAGYALLCGWTRLAGGRDAWPSRLAVLLLLAAAGLGSTLLFLGARAYLYHEAILSGAAFALWSAFFTLRYFENRARRAWIAALLLGIAAVHARPPAGLFALAVLGVVALHAVWQGWRQRTGWREGLLIGALAAVGFASFNGMSYLKFGTFDGSPFRYSVQYTPERRARFENKNFHLANLHHNLDAYLLFPDFRCERRFPFVFFGSNGHRPAYPTAKIDLEEPTLGFPFAMPGLFALAALGGTWAGVRRATFRWPLALVLLGAVPMVGALCTAIVTSHRYTADFCPLLVVCATAGLAAFDAERTLLRSLLFGVASLACVAGACMSLALALLFQGEIVWGVPDEGKRNYEVLRQRVDAFTGARR